MHPFLSGALCLPPFLLATALVGGASAGMENGPLVCFLLVFILTILPPVALAAASRGAGRAVGAMATWWLGLVIVLPAVLGIPRVGAWSVGFEAILPIGPENAEAMAVAVDLLLPSLGRREELKFSSPVDEPPVDVAPSVSYAPSVPPSQGAGLALEDALEYLENQGSATIPYEGSASSMRVPVTLRGETSLETHLVYDTGATLTTIDRRTADQIGLLRPKNAPTIVFQTARGPSKAQIGFLSELILGDIRLTDITVALCDACAMEGSVGLLGLNVSGRLSSHLDPARNVLRLEAREKIPDRTRDVTPWLVLDEPERDRVRAGASAAIQIENRSPRDIERLVIELTCGNAVYPWTGALDAGALTVASWVLPPGAKCASPNLESTFAMWKK